MTTTAEALAGHVFTSRYQSAKLIAASGAAPVRITIGAPRFRLGYQLAASVPVLAPRRAYFHLRGEEFRAAYLADIEQHLGIGGVLEALRQANAATHGDSIVLLCFENVLEGQACHRRMLADWVERRCGLVIPELGAPDALTVVTDDGVTRLTLAGAEHLLTPPPAGEQGRLC